jgi:hypothetical protein
MTVIDSLAHPEFVWRSFVIIVTVVLVVRFLAVVFNRALGIRYSRGREVVVVVVSIGVLCLVFISDYGMAAKAGTLLIGGSFFSAWQDGRSRRNTND